MKKNRGKELIVNTIIIAVGKFSTQLISFIMLPLYTSILTTVEYGIMDLIITISLFVIPLITLLLEESMFRFLIDCKNDEEKGLVISEVFKYIIKSSSICLFLGLIISYVFKIPYALIGIIYIISCLFLTVANCLIRGLGRIKTYTISNFILSIINILLNLIFILYLRWGVYGLLLSSIISQISSSIFIFIKSNLLDLLRAKSRDKTLLKKMIKYSVPLIPNSISWTIVNLSDRLVISKVLGTSANGIYSISYKFPNLMNTIYSFFYTSWKESSAKVMNDADKEEFFNNIYNMLSKIMFSITIGLIAVIPMIFRFFIKSSFEEAYLYIPILIVAMYYSNMSGYYGGIFSGYKDTSVMGITTIIGAIINIVIDILFINFIGIYAAAISTLVSCMFIYYFRKLKIKKYIELKQPRLPLGIFLLIVVFISYYSNVNMYIKVFNLIIIVIYCLFVNKDSIRKIVLLRRK